MSAYAFVAERARKAHSSLSMLERALERSPTDKAIQINLAAMRKLADNAQNELLSLAAINSVEVCNYRLVPDVGHGYAIASISKSWLAYQNLFSQIYDALRNGFAKSKAVIGREAEYESTLEFGYSYSGSLGVVLLAQSERSFFDGSMDKPIEALFDVLNIEDNSSVRDAASALGNAVIKRLYDWSAANIEGCFTTDVRWTRSDGRQLGQVIERNRMVNIVDIINQTSDEKSTYIGALGILVGADLTSRSFHFVIPGAEAYKGFFDKEMLVGSELNVGKLYRALITMVERYHYATDQTDRRFVLNSLIPVSDGSNDRV